MSVDDHAFTFLGGEKGKDVAREHGFYPPDFSASSGFAIPEPWAKRLHTFELGKRFSGEVFAFGLGADTVPSGIILFLVGGAGRWIMFGHFYSPRNF